MLFYDTVHVNSEGEVFFVDDIYGHDRTLDAALRRIRRRRFAWSIGSLMLPSRWPTLSAYGPLTRALPTCRGATEDGGS